MTVSDPRAEEMARTLEQASPGVRTRTLVLIRWIAIVGQLLALGLVWGALRFPLPIVPALLAVAASVAVNLVVHWRLPPGRFLNGRQAGLQLAFDLAQLLILLYLTGGLANPFAVLILVPVTISATLLSRRSTMMLLVEALVGLSGLALTARPLPWIGEKPHFPPIYHFGIWVALVLGMGLLAAYAWQISAEARRRQMALVATQNALAREQKMAALGSLAAAAAHELGSPLGTITLIARELAKELGNDPDFGDDIALLNTQAERCRAILVGIARRAEAEEPFPRVSVAALLHELAAAHPSSRVTLEVVDPARDGNRKQGAAGALMIQHSPEIRHGLDNFVANAVRHAATRVRLEVRQAGPDVLVSVADDGAGFDPHLLPRLGDPDLGPSRSGAGGTGLGIFIATTLLERTGARITFANDPGGGARVDIRWPAESFTATEEPA